MSQHRSSCLASVPLFCLFSASFYHTAEMKRDKSGCATRKLETTCHIRQMWLRFTGSVTSSGWLYYPDHEVLAYFQSQADTWVSNYVRNYTNGVRFLYISVGNEMQPSDPYAMCLLPAMQKIERAVSDLGIKVSTAIDTSGFSGFPPSSGSFTPDFRIFLTPVIEFSGIRKSHLLVNLYTYFGYVNNMRAVSLEYALQ
ncbi:hypothetical protein Rs2_52247 [Raphanus sativus]|nr:hypothetical protein Rs2_52247 [Raphanus sativus]